MPATVTRNGTRTPAPAPPERNLGDWTKALFRMGGRGEDATRARKYLEDRYETKAAMSSTSGITGGYLVPVEFVEDLLAVAQEASIFMREAFRAPLTSAETTIPHVAVDQGAALVSPFFGGARFDWGIEGASVGNTGEPRFSSVALRGHTLAGYAVISNQLLADGENGELSRYLTQLFGQAAGWYYDYACFRGPATGNLQPLGILNAPGKLVVTRGGANDVTAANLAAMVEKILPSAWSPPFNACWALHPSVLSKITAIASWQINQAPLGKEGQLYIHHLPAYVTEKLPGLGTSGDIVLFIPQLYACAIRQDVEVSISRDEPTLFLKGQSAVRVVLRGDGQPRLGTSVTLADGTKTAAMIVTLD